MKEEVKSKLEHYSIVSELKNLKNLCRQIPNSVSFPMFSINCIVVKEILINRVETLLQEVFTDLEKDILRQSSLIDRKHSEIVKYMSKHLNTAEDVQEMDRFTNNLILERSVMRDKIFEWRNNLLKLIEMGYNVSESTQVYTKIIYEWPKKLSQFLDTTS